MKTYELEFDVDALKEWHKLDGSIRAQFKKQIVKRLQVPHVPSAKLHGDLQNTYKIKLRDLTHVPTQTWSFATCWLCASILWKHSMTYPAILDN